MIQWLKDYREKHEGGLITASRNDIDNTMDNRMTITRKQKWEEKQIDGRFKHLTRENLDLAKKRKLSEWNRISPNSNTKQRHKDQSYQSENRQDATK